MDKVHKPVTTQYDTASSKPFTVYQKEKLDVTYVFDEERICILCLNANWEDEH
jgi:hypothetical protein